MSDPGALRAMAARWAEALDPAGSSARGVDVAAALVAAARQGERELAPLLERLAHKVAVARRLDARYGPTWKRIRGAAPLAPAGRALLIALLLAAAHDPAAPDPARRGFALTCLNAALVALELEDAPLPEGAAAELGAAAEALLARLAPQER